MGKRGELNLSIIPAYFDLLKANGVKGAFICGSTGEGVSLSCAERMQVAEAWAEATKGDPDFKVMTMLGGTSITECIDLARHARSVGLYAVSFTAPYYFKPGNVQALAESCIAIAEAAPDIWFYYYHIPVLSGSNFPMLPLLQAVDGVLPNFAGIKYTHEDFMDYLSCLHFQNGKYDMLWGRDECWLAALALGAKGAVGSTYNYAAPVYHQLTAAFQKRDFDEARRLQQQANDMIALLGKYGGIATGKAFMKLIGLDCGEFRLPVKNMTDENFRLFSAEAEKIGFRNFCSRPGALSKT